MVGEAKVNCFLKTGEKSRLGDVRQHPESLKTARRVEGSGTPRLL